MSAPSDKDDFFVNHYKEMEKDAIIISLQRDLNAALRKVHELFDDNVELRKWIASSSISRLRHSSESYESTHAGSDPALGAEAVASTDAGKTVADPVMIMRFEPVCNCSEPDMRESEFGGYVSFDDHIATLSAKDAEIAKARECQESCVVVK